MKPWSPTNAIYSSAACPTNGISRYPPITTKYVSQKLLVSSDFWFTHSDFGDELLRLVGRCLTKSISALTDYQNSAMNSPNSSARLPNNLVEAHEQYKISTGRVLHWLTENGASLHSDITTTQLQEAAEKIRARNVPVPETISRDFRASIEKRQKITNWFTSAELSADGKKSQVTENHIYFTERYGCFNVSFYTANMFSLRKAFVTLCPKRISNSFGQVSGISQNQSRSEMVHNRYEVLSGLDSEPPNISAATEEVPIVAAQNNTSSDAVVLGDPFESLIRIYIVLQTIDYQMIWY